MFVINLKDWCVWVFKKIFWWKEKRLKKIKTEKDLSKAFVYFDTTWLHSAKDKQKENKCNHNPKRLVEILNQTLR